MHLRVILIAISLVLLNNCSNDTAAILGFGKADISPYESSFEMQAPLQSPASFDILPRPE